MTATNNIYIDLDTIKRHLNIDSDYTDEDEYLMMLADVVVRAVENHIDHPLSCFVDESGNLDPALQQACLLLLANFYMNRESESIGHMVQTIGHGYDYLLAPFIDFRDYYARG